MSVLIVLIPLALAIGFAFVLAFIWAASTGQYDDLDTPAVRMLLDDANHTENGVTHLDGELRH